MRLTGFLVLGLSLTFAATAYSAEVINLRHHDITILQPSFANSSKIKFIEKNRSIDFKKTLHVRFQETYAGYPVWLADGVIHLPNGANTAKSFSAVISAAKPNQATLNGIVYQNLDADLANAPINIFTQDQSDQALQQAIAAWQQKIGGVTTIADTASQLIIYIDANNKAHWAFKVSFQAAARTTNNVSALPIYILDATTFEIYQQWNNLQTDFDAVNPVEGGGFGGNVKMGRLSYDGLRAHFDKLYITRDPKLNTCYLENDAITVYNYRTQMVMSFDCLKKAKKHNHVFWDGNFDQVNQGFSPGNDAFFGGQVIKRMYQDWYGLPVLANPDGTPSMLNMLVHIPNYNNAFWNGKIMAFGDGYKIFYPFTSLDITAHEVSHGFTAQHSSLIYIHQSGALNESFSDMAAQAAEIYVYGKNLWQFAPEIFKAPNKAGRYMDKPSKDCYGQTPGNSCSIDDASEYTDTLDVHYASGVYNHFFYLLATTRDWSAKKVFDLIVQANSHYWTAGSTFSDAACGVLSATEDLNFSTEDVKAAFDSVKIDYSNC